MKLLLNNHEFFFQEVKLNFTTGTYSNVFSSKNNKTVRETINHKRYNKFKEVIESRYGNSLDIGLGEFLNQLKQEKDLFYKEFLNKNGDYSYSTFSIQDKSVQMGKGLYTYYVDNELKYIGRCRDSFGKRINQGYGKIHPKNCFIDGQSTNCHLNYLITQNKEKVELYILNLKDEMQIIEIEEALIKNYQPEWNISLKAT